MQIVSEDPIADARYAHNVKGDDPRASLALALLELWSRPWSSRALQFASYALIPSVRRGIDVLEIG